MKDAHTFAERISDDVREDCVSIPIRLRCPWSASTIQ